MEDHEQGTVTHPHASLVTTAPGGLRGNGSYLEDFASIREKRAYERRYLPFLKTVVDFDLACEVGYHQLAGSPLTVKHLLLLKLAAPATVMRRLDRLCALGIVSRMRCRRDGRVHELQLAPAVLRLFADYQRPMNPDLPQEQRGTYA